MTKYNSKKRNQIIQLFIDGSLLSAKEICNKLFNIDRATIYRNLNALVNEGTLREVHINKEYSHYELSHKGDNHQHFICTNCDKVLPVDVDSSIIEKLLPENTKAKEFELNIKGICTDCN